MSLCVRRIYGNQVVCGVLYYVRDVACIGHIKSVRDDLYVYVCDRIYSLLTQTVYMHVRVLNPYTVSMTLCM